MEMTGKVALVTGAGRGLGWGIARAMALAGARVLLTDIDGAELDAVVAGLESEGGHVRGRRLDAADAEDVQDAVDELVGDWGRIDAYVHAGVFMPLERFERMAPADFQRVMDVGFGGLVNGARAAWDAMRRQGGGHLIGIASGSSLRGFVDEVAYCAVKHAQEGFAKSLALEAAADGVPIAVNTMGPGRPIKPTRMAWAELERVPEAERVGWADPTELGRAFVWLACQPPGRFSGLRFDAGTLLDTLAREGPAFDFAPEKVTLFPDDLRAREAWRAAYPG
jgi:NAD(P)-dependent dehydrogenase (short-subunit alcohol dehydrogenase family)